MAQNGEVKPQLTEEEMRIRRERIRQKKARMRQEKKRRKLKKKIIFYAQRIGFVAVCILIVVLIISGISKGIKNKKEEEKQHKASIMSLAGSGIIGGAYDDSLLDKPLTENGLSPNEIRAQFPLFLQTDSRWASEAYGSSTIKVSGCGPTSLSMVVFQLTRNVNATPLAVARYSDSQGYYVEGSGTSWSLMRDGCEHYGVYSKEVPLVEQRMKDALDDGCMIIINVGPGDFTDAGHYLVIYGYNYDGFYVKDPNSLENSNKVWPYDVIEGQISNIWKFQTTPFE